MTKRDFIFFPCRRREKKDQKSQYHRAVTGSATGRKKEATLRYYQRPHKRENREPKMFAAARAREKQKSHDRMGPSQPTSQEQKNDKSRSYEQPNSSLEK